MTFERSSDRSASSWMSSRTNQSWSSTRPRLTGNVADNELHGTQSPVLPAAGEADHEPDARYNQRRPGRVGDPDRTATTPYLRADSDVAGSRPLGIAKMQIPPHLDRVAASIDESNHPRCSLEHHDRWASRASRALNPMTEARQAGAWA